MVGNKHIQWASENGLQKTHPYFREGIAKPSNLKAITAGGMKGGGNTHKKTPVVVVLHSSCRFDPGLVRVKHTVVTPKRVDWYYHPDYGTKAHTLNSDNQPKYIDEVQRVLALRGVS